MRVKVDRDGGVDLDAVTEATRAVSPIVEDLVTGRFTLEVSSPGLERDLRRPEHFRRARGQTVKVKAMGSDGPRRAKGALLESDEEGFAVETERGREHFGYAEVTSARTVFEWNTEPKAGRNR